MQGLKYSNNKRSTGTYIYAWSHHGASLLVQWKSGGGGGLLGKLVFYDNESAKWWKCKENKFIK